MNKIWILVYHINEYNQQDEGYFLEAFKEKPMELELLEHMSFETAKFVVETGGGRQKYEDMWFELLEKELS